MSWWIFLSVIFIATAQDIDAQLCGSILSDGNVTGRTFPGYSLNISQNDDLVVQAAPHVFGCRHLCLFQDKPCKAMSFVNTTSIEKCQLYYGPRAFEHFVAEPSSVVLLFIEKNCTINSTMDGEWSNWTDDINCNGFCDQLSMTESRRCIGLKCHGRPCEGPSRRMRQCRPGECLNLTAFQNWTGSGKTSGNYYFDFLSRRVPIHVGVSSNTIWVWFQRRTDNSVAFNRTWNDYRNGFGSIYGDFWLGNEIIYQLYLSGAVVLSTIVRDVLDAAMKSYYDFSISGENDNYRMAATQKSGSSLESISSHSGYMFSTFDKDNDEQNDNLAQEYEGGWWYGANFHSNLNGRYYGTNEIPPEKHGLYWEAIGDGSQTYTLLRIGFPRT